METMNTRISILRTIGALRQELCAGNVAFFVGAGIDKQLTDDAKSDIKGLDIFSLVREINMFIPSCSDNSKKRPDIWDELILDFPTEFASLARWELGDKKFENIIREKFETGKYIPKNGDNPTKSLCNLLSHSNLIVTTNYAEYLKKALMHFYPEKQYVIIDREELNGFIFPPPCESSIRNCIHTVYIIHLHGRPSRKSFPILDALGYNTILNQGNSYTEFFERLFSQRHVITLGVSWRDVPLRNIAGKIFRQYPYLGKYHLAVYFDDREKFTKSVELKGIGEPSVAFSNVISAVYGTTVLPVDKSSQKKVLDCLNNPLKSPEKNDSLESIAEFFDDNGDFESPFQQQWFSENSFVDRRNNRHDAAINGLKFLIDRTRTELDLNQFDDILTRVKLERHLRHHLYFYPPHDTQVKDFRLKYWKEILPSFIQYAEEIRELDERLYFDFLTGFYELDSKVSFQKPFPISIKLSNDILKKRLENCKYIWSYWEKFQQLKKKSTNICECETLIENYEKLALALLEVGWESGAAKVLADKAFILAFLEKKKGKAKSSKLVSEANRAEGLARSINHYRRRIKSHVLEAIWNQDPYAARATLLAQLQSGSFENSGRFLEPVLRGAIGIGLLVTQFRFGDKVTESTIHETLDEAGLRQYFNNVMDETNLSYWENVIPSDVSKSYNRLNEYSVT